MIYTTEQLVAKFKQFKVIPVISVDNAKDILPLIEILSNNDLPVVEITFRSSAAEDAIRLVREQYPNVLIAAGTVLTEEQVIAAKNAGVDCIVTPGFNSKIVKLCQDVGLPIIPGVNNPMSIEAALEYGISVVKFFPAEASGGIPMIKALLGPYRHLQIMPTGGISIANIQGYLSIPNVIACGGSWFVDKSLINSQNWQEIERLTKEMIELVNKA